MTWAMEAVAYGHNEHETIRASFTFDTKPTSEKLVQAKLNIEKALWHAFSIAFHADPRLVEVHLKEETQP